MANIKKMEWTDKGYYLYNDARNLVGRFDTFRDLEYGIKALEDEGMDDWFVSFQRLPRKGGNIDSLIAFDPDSEWLESPYEAFTLMGKIRGSRKLAEVLKNQTIPVLEALVRIAANLYFNTGRPIIGDDEYDILEAALRTVHPKSAQLKSVGSTPTGDKARLPHPMPSLSKIYEGTSLWKQDGPYVVMEKLDGVSLLYLNDGGRYSLYSRGDGRVGTDVTRLIDYLRLPDIPRNTVIRGELMMSKAEFERVRTAYKNARNLISGLVNSKKISSLLDRTDFVAYEVISPRRKCEESLEWLDRLGFETPWYGIAEELSDPMLADTLMERKKQSDFDIDGLVVWSDARKHAPSASNPKYAIAFKSNAVFESAKVTVDHIEWQVSKYGRLAPVIVFEPVYLDRSADVSRATAFHAKFVTENGIGAGAVVRIVRSGGVIPTIEEVITPVELKESDLPEQDYELTANGLDFVLVDAKGGPDETRIEFLARRLHYMLHDMLQVDQTGEALTQRLVADGFDSVHSILDAGADELQQAMGINIGRVRRIVGDIRSALESRPLQYVLAGFLVVPGMAESKWLSVLEAYPTLLYDLHEDRITLDGALALESPPGIGDSSWKTIVLALPEVINLMVMSGIEHRLENAVDSDLPMAGMQVVLTGTRDKELMSRLQSLGATIKNSVSSSTSYVITDDPQSNSTKMRKARELGLDVWTVDEFNAVLDEMENR